MVASNLARAQYQWWKVCVAANVWRKSHKLYSAIVSLKSGLDMWNFLGLQPQIDSCSRNIETSVQNST